MLIKSSQNNTVLHIPCMNIVYMNVVPPHCQLVQKVKNVDFQYHWVLHTKLSLNQIYNTINLEILTCFSINKNSHSV